MSGYGTVRRRVPGVCRRSGRSADHRPRGGHRERLALGAAWGRRRAGPARHHRRSPRPGRLGHPPGWAETLRWWAAAGLRAPMAAQGDPAGKRPQGASRRGPDLPHRARIRPTGNQRASRTGRGLVRVHPGVQGRGPRGPRGRVHRTHVRQQPAQHPSGSDRRVGGCARGGRGRAGGPGPVGTRPGEQHEVHRRRHAHLVRGLLGRRGCRRRVARLRRRPPGHHPRGRRVRVRPRRGVPAALRAPPPCRATTAGAAS